MPLSHISKVYAVTDAKVRPLLTDPAGGSPTYGAAIDVPGIKSVAITGTIETKRLRGDNTQLDADSVLTELNASFEYAKLSLDLLAAWLGGAVTDSGTTPAQKASWDLTAASKPRPFLFEAVSATADTIGGNVGMVLWKCQPSSFPELGFAEEDYRTGSLEVATSPLISNGKWFTPTLNETAVLAGLSGGV